MVCKNKKIHSESDQMKRTQNKTRQKSSPRIGNFFLLCEKEKSPNLLLNAILCNNLNAAGNKQWHSTLASYLLAEARLELKKIQCLVLSRVVSESALKMERHYYKPQTTKIELVSALSYFVLICCIYQPTPIFSSFFPSFTQIVLTFSFFCQPFFLL